MEGEWVTDWMSLRGRKRTRCDLFQHPFGFTTATTLSVWESRRRHMSPQSQYGNDKRTDGSLWHVETQQTDSWHTTTHTKLSQRGTAGHNYTRQHIQKQNYSIEGAFITTFHSLCNSDKSTFCKCNNRRIVLLICCLQQNKIVLLSTINLSSTLRDHVILETIKLKTAILSTNKQITMSSKYYFTAVYTIKWKLLHLSKKYSWWNSTENIVHTMLLPCSVFQWIHKLLKPSEAPRTDGPV